MKVFFWSCDAGGLLGFLLAFAVCLRGAGYAVWCSGLCAGIRVTLACFTRRPCAGRHLLFFAAAKKSRQKKAAHTASPSSYPRAPNVPILHTAITSFVFVASALAERLTRFTHPRFSMPHQPVHGRPGGKLCVGHSTSHASLRTASAHAPHTVRAPS